MRFPWHKYEELALSRRNTLQVFITNSCNLKRKCEGCFARNIMLNNNHISLEEYSKAIESFISKGGEQVNLLGGEPLLHPKLREIIKMNHDKNIRTTIYTNGYFLDRYTQEDFMHAKLRVSIYCEHGKVKNVSNIPKTDLKIDANFMVAKSTTLEELLNSARHIESDYNCDTFFISSIREMDNQRKEFFDDTDLTMPLFEYKELVHKFLELYDGDMQIHISKRGVFESTKTLPDTTCRFSNYFIGEKIIQCPYDVVNMKFQKDYEFQTRNCQQSNTCLMSKIILQKKYQ